MLGAAHKPGAIPLRPLALGDMYDAAFRIIRFNPQATVGAAVLVTALTMALPVLVTTLLTFTTGVVIDESQDVTGTEEVLGALGAFGSMLGGLVLLVVALGMVNGLVSLVVRAAAEGRRLSLGEAWAATLGKRWRLVGLTVLVNLGMLLYTGAYVTLWFAVVLMSDSVVVIVLWALFGTVAFAAGALWLWVRLYYLPAPSLMLEDVGVLGAIGRGYHLTSGHFWRTLGIALLTLVIASIAGSVLSVPVGLLGQGAGLVWPEYAALGLVLGQALSTVLSAAFVAPFTAAVASLQYVDLRMRKEGYDVELMSRAGVLES
ncbi:hypothetical protein LRP67_19060 [Nocardioides sp. cx-169]|uniref:hypothetical protein n=1 Tax=Nocardioides sp. cx-169 TaxID=2899080 RepID=UPI001E616D15|nr:hypothetical protein [Nocardioides sp. cx-169]MCD4536195.1 hypothetical protein [Nocardioides sp. cx-169]